MSNNSQCGHARFGEDQICEGCGYSAMHIINVHYKPETARLSSIIQEQAKEIEILKRRNSLMQDVIDCALAINSARKTCGKGPIDPNIDYFAKRLSDFDSEDST